MIYSLFASQHWHLAYKLNIAWLQGIDGKCTMHQFLIINMGLQILVWYKVERTQ